MTTPSTNQTKQVIELAISNLEIKANELEATNADRGPVFATSYIAFPSTKMITSPEHKTVVKQLLDRAQALAEPDKMRDEIMRRCLHVDCYLCNTPTPLSRTNPVDGENQQAHPLICVTSHLNTNQVLLEIVAQKEGIGMNLDGASVVDHENHEAARVPVYDVQVVPLVRIVCVACTKKLCKEKNKERAHDEHWEHDYTHEERDWPMKIVSTQIQNLPEKASAILGYEKTLEQMQDIAEAIIQMASEKSTIKKQEVMAVIDPLKSPDVGQIRNLFDMKKILRIYNQGLGNTDTANTEKVSFIENMVIVDPEWKADHCANTACRNPLKEWTGQMIILMCAFPNQFETGFGEYMYTFHPYFFCSGRCKDRFPPQRTMSSLCHIQHLLRETISADPMIRKLVTNVENGTISTCCVYGCNNKLGTSATSVWCGLCHDFAFCKSKACLSRVLQLCREKNVDTKRYTHPFCVPREQTIISLTEEQIKKAVYS